MNDCKTCKHFSTVKGNFLCGRTRTFADLRKRDTPIFIVLERGHPDSWNGMNRRVIGDVCGIGGNHWVQK